MIICISGTHCTGKSTLMEVLKKHAVTKNAVYLKSSGRELKEKNPDLKINENGDFFTQLYIMSKDSKDILEVCKSKDSLIICDRFYWDTFVYSEYLYKTGLLSIREFNHLKSLRECLDYYVKPDKVFLSEPYYELQNEKNRSMNQDFQMEIRDLFDSHKDEYNTEYLPNTLEDRVNNIISFINNFKN